MSFLERVALVTVAALVAVGMAAPTTFSSMSYVANVRIHPFAEMPLPNYYMLDGATVAIEYGFNSGYDQLLLDYEGDYPIMTSFSSQTGILYLSGMAPISEYSAAIQSVVFVTSASDGDNRVVTFTYGTNTTYSTSTEHFYRYVFNPTSAWGQAAQDCTERSYMGMQGYLATITSEREMLEVVGRTSFSAWLGATSNQQGAWSWVTGPEGLEHSGAGRMFWNGSSMYSGGSPANWLSFNQWYRFRPNAVSAGYLSSKPPMFANIAYLYNSLNTDFVQGWICEFGGLDNAAVAATTWQYTGSMTLQFDCSLFGTNSDCLNHASQGCGWSFGSCRITDCSRYLLQSSCVSNWQCDWFVNGEVGVCANTQCAQYADAPTCNLDPGCRAANIAGSQQCLVAACSDKTSACTCTAMTGCSWLSSKCYTTDFTGCSGLDVVYLIDGSVNMSQAFERYPNGFVGVTQAIMGADFALTGQGASASANELTAGMRIGIVQFGGASAITSPSTIGSGGRLTGSKTELQADLRFHQRAYTASVTTRTLYPSFITALNMVSMSVRKKVMVVLSSGGIDMTSANIANIRQRLQQIGATMIGVTLQPTEPKTPDSIASYNSLASLTALTLNTTMTNFNTQVLEGLCGMTPKTLGPMVSKAGMPVIGGKPLCQTYWDAPTCNTRADCSWDLAAQACGQSGCMEYCTQSACAADPSCSYVSSQSLCLQTCPQAVSSAACDTPTLRNICIWSASMSQCVDQACVSNPNEDACIADTNNCVYNPNTPTKCVLDRCAPVTSQSTCLATAGCGWSSGNCFINYCATTNATVCGSYAQCQWSNNTCSLTTCGTYVSEQSCQSDRRCAWDVTMAPAGCGPALCRNFTTSSGCSTNPACYWQPFSENGFQDMCIVKPCSANVRSCDCAGQNGCVWTNNTCKDTTFVQCPAMDVVFLIEATPPMSESFGRHPNGFSGIVESIRSWAKDVPMSSIPSQKGFRLAVVGYGFQQTPLQPSSAIGGQSFCSNSTRFTGVNMILDNFAAQQATYANAVGSEVAILPGLQAATQLFNGSSVPGRKRLLMILGHGAITDGAGSMVSSQISTLEALGVEVFSNVVRRFSVITPAETMAAEYLRPLASDPVETHYSFSTIDEMQSSILESFCDPSTTIGEALGISRDGTLPCNWLTGAAECNVQGSCYWNSSALPTCPLAGQCPNLGCVSLPPALAAQFECKHCEYMGGAFSCDRSKNFAPAAGVCLQTPCSANCASTSCSGSCTWDSSATRCQRAMCTATTPSTCNMDLGCVWVGGTAGQCMRSICGNTRTAAGCQSLSTDGFNRPCTWNTTLTPAVCVQSRCPMMDQVVCNQFPANCEFSAIGGSCVEKLCQYTDAELCSSDSGCYWNPYVRVGLQFGSCNARQRSCVLTDSFSSWSPCTANCGSGAVRYRSKAIVQFPQAGGRSCADVAGAAGLSQSEACNASTISTWSSDCNSYCSQYGSSVTSCIRDISCQWANAMCVPRTVSGCAAITTSAACSASDMCSWDANLMFCEDAPQACRYATMAQCTSVSSCVWRTGANPNLMASALGLEGYLVNPGQAPIHPFPTLSINSNAMISGARVTIENGYQLGKDLLEMTYPTTIQTMWVPSSGTLQLSGAATASEYGYVIRAVTFYTSSLGSGSRNITFALGNGTLFSLSTGHYYRFYSQQAVSWDQASQLCSATSHFGLGGYLATITSAQENSLVSTKLNGFGWLGAGADGSTWSWSGGPEAAQPFWLGASLAQGGAAVPGAFANWDPIVGEPTLQSSATSRARVYLNETGYWGAKLSSSTSSNGFTCEYGGLATDRLTANFTINGGVVIGIGGCLPQTQCSYHSSQAMCLADSSCIWSGYNCLVGCGARSTVAECSQNTQCAWSVTILPPLCDLDPCKPFAAPDCDTRSQCRWNGTMCLLKTGCGQYTASTCNNFASCQYVNNSCVTKRCPTITTATSCVAVPLCTWSTQTGCASACKYTGSEDCTADPACQWASGTTTATPFYAGGTPIYPFATGTQAPSTNNGYIDGITVRVASGFQQGNDVLSVASGNANRFTYIASYSSLSGVLQLVVASGSMVTPLQAYAFLTSAVQFSTSGSTLIPRKISYVLSIRAASVNGTVYKVVSARNIRTTSDAAAACNATTLFGLRGALATIKHQTINVALAQINAQGLIAATSTGNGLWQWSANGASFWSGNGATGIAIGGAFAAWPFQEPQNGYTMASIGPGGLWFSAMPTQRTYSAICEFGGDLTMFTGGAISGAIVLTPQGCFPQPCAGLGYTGCGLQYGCAWSVSTSSCTADTWCAVTSDTATCKSMAGCYWEYATSSCRLLPTDNCQPQRTQQLCNQVQGCSWSPQLQQQDRSWGACRLTGCTMNPSQSSCTSDPTCRWYLPLSTTTSVCVSRLCGYTAAADCRSDANCAWLAASASSSTFTCQKSPCTTVAVASCSSTNGCMLDATSTMCVSKPCFASTRSACLADPSCIFLNGQCSQPECTGTTVSTCDPTKCYFTFDPPSCTAAQCVSYSAKEDCEPAGLNSICRWGSTSTCRQATWLELNSPNGTITDTCVKQQDPNLTWLYIVLAVIFVLIALLAYRLFLAFYRGLNFLSSSRNNQQFKVHKKYASDLFDESRERATHDLDYRHPVINDL